MPATDRVRHALGDLDAVASVPESGGVPTGGLWVGNAQRVNKALAFEDQRASALERPGARRWQ